MDPKKLNELRLSDEAPFDHLEFTIWIHNKIIDEINFDLWNFREQKSGGILSSYAACNHIMDLPSLKKIQ